MQRSGSGLLSVLSYSPGERSPVARWLTPLGTLLVLGYFGFHAFNGQYGIRASLAFQTREAELVDQLTVLQERRERLEARVLLLREGTLERDMVDERARKLLGLARADEVLIDLR